MRKPLIRRFSRGAGGPLVHIIAAKAVAFKEDSEPSFKEYSAQVVKNARPWPRLLLLRV